ncbi:hypothetical protein WJX75_001737 [Coccomyxa subellipsoidea]|uniref:Glycosyltransferase n=1 Tax=Coccomyxa subellipsoidea TaxID=248742 RepID=A0ABR2YR67_9CHLO
MYWLMCCVKVASRIPDAACMVACPPAKTGAAEEGGLSDVHAWLGQIAAETTRFSEQAQDEDLGKRMYHALHEAVSADSSKAVLIGSDIPDICESVLEAAFAALEEHQVVFGPSIDGGYYLVGASRLPPDMFEGISWSTSSVLSESMSQAASIGLNVAPRSTLPVLRDIDTIEDLQAWMEGHHDLQHPVRGISTKLVAARRDA